MILRVFSRYASTARPSFTYPQRITRSSTALLESLNSCVQTEGGNPAYMFMDDPFLIPTSAYEKQQLALSKASGKKAARWIIDRYSYAFFHDVAVPSIPSYFPNYTFDEIEFVEPDETTVYKLMNWNQINKAHEIYKKCLEYQVPISDSCKYALFDLLCIYNSENPKEILLPEEDWYRRELGENNQSGAVKRTWKENGLAEQMFDELKLSASTEQKFRLYNSFVCGLLKYNHTEKAMTIIGEMKDSQIPLNLTTYNSLLRSTSLIKESYETRWQFVTECLQEMKERNIQPNLRTFNAIFYTLRRCSLYERGLGLALSTLKEMRQCGIEPSLGTWAHLIMIFYPNDQLGSDTQILPQILDQLKDQELSWRDPDDGEFFFNAMFKATVNCRDVDLAKRLHQFLMTGSNSRFIPDGFKEQMYYTNFFRLLFRIDMPEHVMPIWESVVPNVYSPSGNIMEEFMEFLSTWKISEYYVRLWSDLLMLGLIDSRQNNRRILERYFTLINRQEEENLTQEQIKQYANVARQLLKRFPLQPEAEAEEEVPTSTTTEGEQQQQQPSKRFVKQPFQYSGSLLTNLIGLLIRADDFEAGWSLYEHYRSNKNTVIQPLTEQSLMALLSSAVQGNHIDRALSVIETIKEMNYECLSDSLDLLNRNIHLNHHDRLRLRTIQNSSSLKSAHDVKLV